MTDVAALLPVRDLGVLSYDAALAVQRETHARVAARTAGGGDGDGAVGELLLVEHTPVITVSRRKSAPGHVLADEQALRRAGVTVVLTDRGGDVTYHGPGQIVAYPILRLARLGMHIGGYMRLLEQAIMNALSDFDIDTHRDPTATGVWAGPQSDPDAAGAATPQPKPSDPPLRPQKIAAIGVRLTRGVTLHGLALNVRTNLDHFRLIVPCGLHDRGVTSMQAILGDQTPPMALVKRKLAESLQRQVALAGASRQPASVV